MTRGRASRLWSDSHTREAPAGVALSFVLCLRLLRGAAAGMRR